MLYLKCAPRVGDGLAYVSGGHVALYFDFGYNGLCKLWGYLFAAEFYSNWITVSLSIEKVCTALLCPLLALYCTVLYTCVTSLQIGTFLFPRKKPSIIA